MAGSKRRLEEWCLTVPSFVWLSLFFLVPTIIVFTYAFKPYNIYGGIGEGWTLNTLLELFDRSYLMMFWRTLWLSITATLICLLLALPMGYQLATTTPKWKNLMLMMVVIPFWSSFLIRIYAWKIVLHPDGILKKALEFFHIVSPETTLLYNSGAVLFVMVYTLLPFAVLPIYAAASKFNLQLLEAAMDLGASRRQAFLRIFIPGIRKGIATAFVMVFIPAVGTYVISDLVGGTDSQMIGNLIAQKTLMERNLPQASALSALLALGVFTAIGAIALYTGTGRKLAETVRNRE